MASTGCVLCQGGQSKKKKEEARPNDDISNAKTTKGFSERRIVRLETITNLFFYKLSRLSVFCWNSLKKNPQRH